jgi:hypothetical protein
MSGTRNSQKNKSCCWCSCCCHLCPDNDNEFSPKKVRVCAERACCWHTRRSSLSFGVLLTFRTEQSDDCVTCQCAAPCPHRVHDLPVPSFASSIAQSFSLYCLENSVTLALALCVRIYLLLLHRIKIPSSSSSSSSSSCPCQQQ